MAGVKAMNYISTTIVRLLELFMHRSVNGCYR